MAHCLEHLFIHKDEGPGKLITEHDHNMIGYKLGSGISLNGMEWKFAQDFFYS
jgi:hypothetical protein